MHEELKEFFSQVETHESGSLKQSFNRIKFQKALVFSATEFQGKHSKYYFTYGGLPKQVTIW